VRRLQIVVVLLAAAAVLVVAGIAGGRGGGASARIAADGSTLRATWIDPDGDGTPRPGPGEPLRARVDLAPRARPGKVLATLGVLTDVHVRDEESPVRPTVLDRLGRPFTSTFRPQDALSSQVLAAAVRSLDAARPQVALVLGDLVDGAQRNELDLAATVLRGGTARPDSGAPGYDGPQQATNADPAYYRPDVDAPRLPGLLARAQRPFRAQGLTMPLRLVPGNHDLLVAGEIARTARTNAIATGDRMLDGLDPSVLPAQRGEAALRGHAIDRLLADGLPGPTRRVPADPRREELTPAAATARLRALGGLRPSARRLDQAFDVGPRVRVIMLDTVDRRFGAGGTVSHAQVRWLAGQLRRAGRRWVIVASHHHLESARGGGAVLRLLDRDPHVLAALNGDSHHHRIRPRRTAAGGYWLVGTASLADWPQQGRMLRVRATSGGGAVLETWALDTAPGRLADEARLLAHLDAQGGRPAGARGTVLDRNVALHKAPPRTIGAG
jgi:3',5'-cyclic AMP phosphodiesterase CpdA